MAPPNADQAYFTIAGIGSWMLANGTSKRPLFSPGYTGICIGTAAAIFYTYRNGFCIPLVPVYAGVGYILGTMLRDFKHKRVVQRELALWDYVSKHPEDFPELDQRKYKDVLLEWHPIR